MIVALIVGTSPAGAQNAREPGSGGDPFEVPRATSEITVDGVIDEAAWDDALQLELNFEVRPGENIKPRVETMVFITYDTTHLLVAFRASDPAPEPNEATMILSPGSATSSTAERPIIAAPA